MRNDEDDSDDPTSVFYRSPAQAAFEAARAGTTKWTIEFRKGVEKYELKEGTAHRGLYPTGQAALDQARNLGVREANIRFI